MTPLDLVKISSSALVKHKVRSGLTLLGIVIGIISVGSIVSVVRGVDRYVTDIFGTIGSQGFVVTKMGLVGSEEQFLKALKRRELPTSAAREIKESIPSVEWAAPFIQTQADVKSRWEISRDVGVDGTSPDAQYMTEIGLSDGRYFNDFEVHHARQVCIVGSDVAEKVFPGLDPVGRSLYIKGHRFTVIGHHEKMGTVMGHSQDDFVRIPYTTFEKVFGSGFPTTISLRSRSPEEVSTAIEEVRMKLRLIRGLRPGDEDDFGIITANTLVDAWRRLSGILFIATVGVGSIALLVGGIGIMNIMFVSVKERTMEIGLRKAIGARRRDIMLQFLTESALLCLTGGLVGLGLGLGLAKVISLVTSLPISMSLDTIAIPLVVSVAVGLFFGVYPAVRAASMQPVNALRYKQ
jgi:putative ABC transport system permease protein